MNSATFVKDLLVELYIMFLCCHLTKYEHTHAALVLCPFVSCPFAVNPFAHLHHFLICTLILSLSPTGRLCTKTRRHRVGTDTRYQYMYSNFLQYSQVIFQLRESTTTSLLTYGITFPVLLFIHFHQWSWNLDGS